MFTGVVPYWCAECEADKVNYVENHRQGDLVCTDCGLVLGGVICDEPERRTFADSAVDHCRAGGGVVDPRFEDCGMVSSGGPRPGQRGVRRALCRPQRSAADQQLQKHLAQARRDCANLGVSRRIEGRCGDLLAACLKAKHLKVNPVGLCAAALYAACRLEGCPRNLREVCVATDTPRKTFTRATRHLKALLTTPCMRCSAPATLRVEDRVVCARHEWALQLPEPCPQAVWDEHVRPVRSPLEGAELLDVPKLCDQACSQAGVADYGVVRRVQAAVAAATGLDLPVFAQEDVDRGTLFRGAPGGRLVRERDGTTMAAAPHGGGDGPAEGAEYRLLRLEEGGVAVFPGFRLLGRAVTRHDPMTTVAACVHGAAPALDPAAVQAATGVSKATLTAAWRDLALHGAVAAAVRPAA